MPRRFTPIGIAALALALAAFFMADRFAARYPRAALSRFRVELKDVAIRPPARRDRSARLAAQFTPTLVNDADGGLYEAALGAPDGALAPPGPGPAHASVSAPVISTPAGSGAVEQRWQGRRPALAAVASFDGLGHGFTGPQGSARLANPSDNSLAVGHDYIVQIANNRMAIFTRKGAKFDTNGRVLYGPVETGNVFRGFGGACETGGSGDAVVRYDQLASRWLIVMPVFRPQADSAGGKYAMCYAVSQGTSPFGPYYRYEFRRALFPDYPRPAVWPDGYYVPTSNGGNAMQGNACVADRARMLRGQPATEQCVVIDGASVLNVADLDGMALPPTGTPAVVMATSGSQRDGQVVDSTILVWRLHVNWANPVLTGVAGPERVAVAPYHYLCDGQLSSCVPQPGTATRLDAQGDKLMARLTYRRIGTRQSIVAVQSVNTTLGAGGVRWYEFRLVQGGGVSLFQQGTFAPDSQFRWMASAAMDARGDIGIGYSYGGAAEYPGQRFTGRLHDDPPGQLTFDESVLAQGQGSQTGTLRWQDYTQTAVDPRDDCTIWYVGDYFRQGAAGYSSRIGAYRFPGCASAAQ